MRKKPNFGGRPSTLEQPDQMNLYVEGDIPGLADQLAERASKGGGARKTSRAQYVSDLIREKHSEVFRTKAVKKV